MALIVISQDKTLSGMLLSSDGTDEKIFMFSEKR